MKIKFNKFERVAGIFVLTAIVGGVAVMIGVAVKKGWFETKIKFETMLKNADVLMQVRAAFPQLFMVGFAAETENLAEHARAKLAKKQLNLIAANWVGHGRAFDTDDNALSVFWADGAQEIAHGPKAEVAAALAQLIASHYLQKP